MTYPLLYNSHHRSSPLIYGIPSNSACAPAERVVAASVDSLGAPVSTPGSAASRRIYHRRQAPPRRPVPSISQSMLSAGLYGEALQETAGVLRPLGSPVELTCGIPSPWTSVLTPYPHNFSLTPMTQGMFINRRMCSEIADLVTGYSNTIREELDEAAKGDANSGPWSRNMLSEQLCSD